MTDDFLSCSVEVILLLAATLVIAAELRDVEQPHTLRTSGVRVIVVERCR